MINIVYLRRTFWFLLALSLVAAVFFTAGRLGAVQNDPDWNCHVSQIDDIWSSDRLYEAALARKSCNQGESIFYTVRLTYHAPSSPPLNGRSWFVIHELENDDYPEETPRLYWEHPHQLTAEIKTRGLAGTLTLHHPQEVTFVRKYFARETD